MQESDLLFSLLYKSKIVSKFYKKGVLSEQVI